MNSQDLFKKSFKLYLLIKYATPITHHGHKETELKENAFKNS